MGFIAKLAGADGNVIYAALVNDPVLALAVDSQGATYAAGSASSDLPTTPGAYQVNPGGGLCFRNFLNAPPAPCPDAFVLKLNAEGSAPIYVTYLGGSDDEAANAIAVDSQGNAYVTGWTVSADFPVTPGAAQTKFGGKLTIGPLWFGDAFVTKIDSRGAALIYSTYLGGKNNGDEGKAIAVDNEGNVYVTGATASSDFPVTPGAYETQWQPRSQAPAARGSGFVTKLDNSGRIVVSTFVAETGGIDALALDSAGQVYIGSPPGSATAGRFAGHPGMTSLCSARMARA
jgi:hypothetical protein